MWESVREGLQQIVLPALGATLLWALGVLAREQAKRIKDERLRALILALVQAAEQIYGPGQGAAKRRYVEDKLEQQGLGRLGREELEAAVYRLRKEAQKAPAASSGTP